MYCPPGLWWDGGDVLLEPREYGLHAMTSLEDTTGSVLQSRLSNLFITHGSGQNLLSFNLHPALMYIICLN